MSKKLQILKGHLLAPPGDPGSNPAVGLAMAIFFFFFFFVIFGLLFLKDTYNSHIVFQIYILITH